MPADIECIAYVLDAEEDDGTTLHECHLQNGHRDPHECLCGERWPHLGQAPFESTPMSQAEARVARDRLMADFRPPESGYRSLEQQQAIYDRRSNPDG